MIKSQGHGRDTFSDALNNEHCKILFLSEVLAASEKADKFQFLFHTGTLAITV